MTQPHITHETYKGLTPEEQEKYGEEVWLERNVFGGLWQKVHQITMADYNEDFDDFSRDRDASVETMRIHYLKPVEAQQSEAEGVNETWHHAFSRWCHEKPKYANAPCIFQFEYAVNWQASQNLKVIAERDELIYRYDCLEHEHAEAITEITALQQEVERLKEAQRWIPVSEGLPENNQLVIMRNKRGTYSFAHYTSFYKDLLSEWIAFENIKAPTH